MPEASAQHNTSRRRHVLWPCRIVKEYPVVEVPRKCQQQGSRWIWSLLHKGGQSIIIILLDMLKSGGPNAGRS